MQRAPQPPPLYAIADAEALAPRAVSAAVEELLEVGIRWIQVRAKRLADRMLLRELERCSRAAAAAEASLWVDDRADLAALVPVAGLQLGQADLPPRAARRVVGETLWIGRSTHNREQFLAAAADAAVDVVALGPIFSTTGKRRPDPVVGLELLRSLAPLTDKPVVAIGGIDGSNLAAVLAAGADSVAVLGAFCRGDIRKNSRRLQAAVEGMA